jgi:hypothetical protein
MNVGELRSVLTNLPSNMKVGVTDTDGEVAEVQSASVVSHDWTGEQFFFIHPNGGFLLFPVEDSTK